MNDPHVVTFFDSWDAISDVMYFKSERDAINFVASHASRKTVRDDESIEYDCFDKKHWYSYSIDPYEEPDFLVCEATSDHSTPVPFPYKDSFTWYYRTQDEVDAVMRINGYNPDGSKRKFHMEKRGDIYPIDVCVYDE